MSGWNNNNNKKKKEHDDEEGQSDREILDRYNRIRQLMLNRRLINDERITGQRREAEPSDERARAALVRMRATLDEYVSDESLPPTPEDAWEERPITQELPPLPPTPDEAWEERPITQELPPLPDDEWSDEEERPITQEQLYVLPSPGRVVVGTPSDDGGGGGDDGGGGGDDASEGGMTDDSDYDEWVYPLEPHPGVDTATTRWYRPLLRYVPHIRDKMIQAFMSLDIVVQRYHPWNHWGGIDVPVVRGIPIDIITNENINCTSVLTGVRRVGQLYKFSFDTAFLDNTNHWRLMWTPIYERVHHANKTALAYNDVVPFNTTLYVGDELRGPRRAQRLSMRAQVAERSVFDLSPGAPVFAHVRIRYQNLVFIFYQIHRQVVRFMQNPSNFYGGLLPVGMSPYKIDITIRLYSRPHSLNPRADRYVTFPYNEITRLADGQASVELRNFMFTILNILYSPDEDSDGQTYRGEFEWDPFWFLLSYVKRRPMAAYGRNKKAPCSFVFDTVPVVSDCIRESVRILRPESATLFENVTTIEEATKRIIDNDIPLHIIYNTVKIRDDWAGPQQPIQAYHRKRLKHFKLVNPSSNELVYYHKSPHVDAQFIIYDVATKHCEPADNVITEPLLRDHVALSSKYLAILSDNNEEVKVIVTPVIKTSAPRVSGVDDDRVLYCFMRCVSVTTHELTGVVDGIPDTLILKVGAMFLRWDDLVRLDEIEKSADEEAFAAFEAEHFTMYESNEFIETLIMLCHPEDGEYVRAVLVTAQSHSIDHFHLINMFEKYHNGNPFISVSHIKYGSTTSISGINFVGTVGSVFDLNGHMKIRTHADLAKTMNITFSSRHLPQMDGPECDIQTAYYTLPRDQFETYCETAIRPAGSFSVATTTAIAYFRYARILHSLDPVQALFEYKNTTVLDYPSSFGLMYAVNENYRTRETDIKLEQLNYETFSVIKRATPGPRCDMYDGVNKLVHEPIVQLDVASCYPFVMAFMKDVYFPTGGVSIQAIQTPEFIADLTPKLQPDVSSKETLGYYLVTVDQTILQRRNRNPIIPLMKRPPGSSKRYDFSPEVLVQERIYLSNVTIRCLLRYGCTVTFIEDAVCYTFSERRANHVLFGEVVSSLMTARAVAFRDEATQHHASIIKGLVNGLYGKYYSSPSDTFIVPISDHYVNINHFDVKNAVPGSQVVLGDVTPTHAAVQFKRDVKNMRQLPPIQIGGILLDHYNAFTYDAMFGQFNRSDCIYTDTDSLFISARVFDPCRSILSSMRLSTNRFARQFNNLYADQQTYVTQRQSLFICGVVNITTNSTIGIFFRPKCYMLFNPSSEYSRCLMAGMSKDTILLDNEPANNHHEFVKITDGLGYPTISSDPMAHEYFMGHQDRSISTFTNLYTAALRIQSEGHCYFLSRQCHRSIINHSYAYKYILKKITF